METQCIQKTFEFQALGRSIQEDRRRGGPDRVGVRGRVFAVASKTAQADRVGHRRYRRPAARRPVGQVFPRLLQELLLPAAVYILWRPSLLNIHSSRKPVDWPMTIQHGTQPRTGETCGLGLDTPDATTCSSEGAGGGEQCVKLIAQSPRTTSRPPSPRGWFSQSR